MTILLPGLCKIKATLKTCRILGSSLVSILKSPNSGRCIESEIVTEANQPKQTVVPHFPFTFTSTSPRFLTPLYQPTILIPPNYIFQHLSITIQQGATVIV